MMRALFLEYPKDEATYNLSGEYLFGRDLLVALAAVILLMGIYPQMFLRKLDMTATTIVQRVEPGSLAYQPARRSTAQNR